MIDLNLIVNDYLNDKLLSLNDLPTKLETTMIDRLFAKKFRKYSIAPSSAPLKKIFQNLSKSA